LRFAFWRNSPQRRIRQDAPRSDIGAGDAGALVVRELQKSAQLNLTPIAFWMMIVPSEAGNLWRAGDRVCSDIADVLDSQHVDEVIFAIPSAPGRVVRLVNDACG